MVMSIRTAVEPAVPFKLALIFHSDTRFPESFSIVNHLVHYKDLCDDGPLGKKVTPMTKGKPSTLTGEMIWASCREK
jgi:hypothetical protein